MQHSAFHITCQVRKYLPQIRAEVEYDMDSSAGITDGLNK